MRNLLIYSLFLLITSCSGNKSSHEQVTNYNHSQQLINAYHDGDWNTIINITDSLIIKNHPIDDIRIIYAEALGVTNQIDKGIEVLNIEIAKESQNYFLYKTLGVLYSLNENCKQAIKNYEKSIEVKSTFV